jgi:sarcosine oxidase
MIGPPDGAVAGGARASALAYELPFESLSAEELHRRVPGFRPTVDMVGVLEPRAGFLVPEAALEAHLALARRYGADLRVDEPVVEWAASEGGGAVTVTTPRGRYAADRLVLSVGAWTRELVPELDLPLTVERNVVYWFRPARATALFAPDRFPVFICEYAPGRVWYGIPDVGDGVKVALHHEGETADPDAPRREVAPDEVAHVRALLRVFMPEADGPLAASTVCLYTNTPDERFVLDAHPEHPAVIVASACSGHGFKFASAIGEILADLALEGRSAFDLTPFAIARLRKTADRA